MALMSVILSDIEAYFSCLKLFYIWYLGKYTTCYLGCVYRRIGKCAWPITATARHRTWRASKVTVSHVHCQSGNISKTVQDRDVVATMTTNRKWCTTCRISLSDLQRNEFAHITYKPCLLYIEKCKMSVLNNTSSSAFAAVPIGQVLKARHSFLSSMKIVNCGCPIKPQNDQDNAIVTTKTCLQRQRYHAFCFQQVHNWLRRGTNVTFLEPAASKITYYTDRAETCCWCQQLTLISLVTGAQACRVHDADELLCRDSWDARSAIRSSRLLHPWRNAAARILTTNPGYTQVAVVAIRGGSIWKVSGLVFLISLYALVWTQVVRRMTSDVLWVCACEKMSTAMAPQSVLTAVMNRQTVAVSFYFLLSPAIALAMVKTVVFWFCYLFYYILRES